MDGLAKPADDAPSRRTQPHEPIVREAHVRGEPGQIGLMTFLFADIRGFTTYTERHGSEAAARLADAFVTLAAAVVAAYSGRLRGSWGDQVLVEFSSPRDALRAALDVQSRCVEATVREPSMPLAVGVGLDVGEPAAEGDQQSAAALNVAARLCARAEPAEILSTAALVHLAGSLPGVSYVDRGAVRLKGISTPTRIVLVRAAAVDAQRLREFRRVLTEGTRPSRNPRAWVAALVALAMVAAVASWALSRTGDDDPVTVPADGVAVVDESSGHLVDAVEGGGAPEGVVASVDAVWIAQSSADAVLRLDRETKVIEQSIPVGRSPVAVAVSGQDVWVVNSQDNTVSRISTTTNREVDRVTGVGNQPVAIAAGFGSLWVANQADATVARIDARTGKVDPRRVQVGRGPSGVAAGAGAVWVTNGRDGTVSPVDPTTLKAGAPIPVGAGPKGIAVASSGVWVANRLDLTVSHIDPVSRRETAKVTVGDSPFAVAVGRGAVWVSASDDGTLVAIDPARKTVTRTVSLGASPYGLALVGSAVWAATRPFASARHFGGTLRLAGTHVPESLDPAVSYDYDILSLIYDGLVGYRRAGGADNFEPVPNLAVTLPRPTDGGRTYSFRVRSGIRYSDGRTLVPADFRRGLERAFTAAIRADGGNEGYYTNIVGADKCVDPKGSCDLSAGIVTDDSTVTFRLTEADPEFLFKLALTHASPAPPATPAGPVGAIPITGTGPYAVAEFSPGKSLRLERNPRFRSWSAAARPVGYPDAITSRILPSTRLVREVETGGADLVNLLEVPAEDARDVALRRPAQVHQGLFAFTVWVVLDKKRPPFNRVAARRAVALALDRGRFAEAFHGTREQAACGLLPPGFPGYEPYCPFTANPGPSKTWQAPDVPRARRLIARSGTGGATVEVYWANGDESFAATGRDTTRMLRDLGYDARLHLISGFPDGTERPRPHVTVYGWYATFPLASEFYRPLLSCAAVSGSTLSPPCNRDLDALAARAIEIGESDPGGADRLWKRVYRAITDQAYVVPATHGIHASLVSERVGNFEIGNSLGPLYDQAWVR